METKTRRNRKANYVIFDDRGRQHDFDLAEIIPEEFKIAHRRTLTQRARQNIDVMNMMDNVEPPGIDLASLMHDMHINRRLQMHHHSVVDNPFQVQHSGEQINPFHHHHDGLLHDSSFHDGPFVDGDGPFDDDDGPFHDGPFDDDDDPLHDSLFHDGPFDDNDGPLHDGPFDDDDNPLHDSLFYDGPFDDDDDPLHDSLFHDGPFDDNDGPLHDGPFDDDDNPLHDGPFDDDDGPFHGGPFDDDDGPFHDGPFDDDDGPFHDGPFDDDDGPFHDGPFDDDDGPFHVGPFEDGHHHGGPQIISSLANPETNDEILEFSSGKTITVAVQKTCNCTTITDTILTALPSTDQVYQDIASEVNSTIQHHASGMTYSSCNIVSIEKVENCCIWRKYSNRRLDIQKEGYSVNQKLLFHGSSVAMDIVNRGFDERHSKKGGMFGAGIYFAEHSSKSNQYVFGYMGSNGCPSHKKANCTSCERYMLLCSVTLGIQHRLTQSNKMAHPPPGFHSVVGVPSSSGLRYPEYIIYRGEQAYPAFLIKYKIVL